jgi:hypothetical protein
MKSQRYLLLLCLIAVKGLAQQGPRPGDIYREYAVNLRTEDNWRVTDPNASNPGAAEFLPNPVLSMQIDDLDKAVRAEVLMDIWGGHPGTSGKKFRFNANPWMDIPRVPTLVISSQCYMKQYNVILDLPLEYLHEGENTFEGTSGGQVCGNFNWGQWGWYVMMVRVYYQPEKAHTAGQISYPLSEDIITDDPLIEVETADSGAVSSIQILGHYYGYDEDGDGYYRDWHRAYHDTEITGHIGTLKEAPFQHTWNTRYIPDQDTGSISLMARVQDTSGIWFVADIVNGITLQRPDSLSVRMHKAYDVQERFWVRAGQSKHCYINLSDPEQAMEAYLYHRTWNAGDDEVAGGTIEKPLRVNGHAYKCYGKNHRYALSAVQIATGDLKEGANKIAYASNTVHHGIEILWPGPALVVRYVSGGDTLSNPVFSPPDGTTFQDILNPSILYDFDGRKIYYTTDGSDPNPSDERYRGQQLRVDKDMTFKARAFKRDSYESEVVTASYTLDLTAVNPFPETDLMLFPNPASHSIYLELLPGMENGSYLIYDLEGRLVLKGRAVGNEIKLVDLNNGIYILKYEAPRQIFTTRFVVQR